MVRPAVSTASGWHPPRAISHPWHTAGKGLCILLCPDSCAHASALLGAVLARCTPIFWEVRLERPGALPCLSALLGRDTIQALSGLQFQVAFLKGHGGFSGTGR